MYFLLCKMHVFDLMVSSGFVGGEEDKRYNGVRGQVSQCPWEGGRDRGTATGEREAVTTGVDFLCGMRVVRR